MVDDLEEILGRTREIATSIVAANSDRTDREARWPEENIRALLDAGLGGLVLPPAAGGLGQRLLGLARVCEELARECPSTGICFGMHHVGAAVLAAKATRAQTEAYLVPIARGAHIATLALSEPGTGGDFYLPESRLECPLYPSKPRAAARRPGPLQCLGQPRSPATSSPSVTSAVSACPSSTSR